MKSILTNTSFLRTVLVLINLAIFNVYIYSQGNVGIGTNNPTQTLDVNGNIRIRGGEPEVGKLLRTDANGNASWEILKGSDFIPSSDFPIPITPNLISTLTIGANPVDIVCQNGYAYVIDFTTDDLRTIFIGSPEAMSVSNILSLGSNPRAIAIQGHYLYIVDTGSDDLKIFNISNPAVPSLVSSTPIGPSATDVEVFGDYAYILDSTNDNLTIFMISNPAAPILMSAYTLGTLPIAMATDGSYVYVVDSGTDDLKIINVTNPSSPMFAGSLGIGPSPRKIVSAGQYVFVIDQSNFDFRVISVSNPALPVQQGFLQLNFFPTSLVVQNNYAYIGDDNFGALRVVDVTNAASPTIIAQGGSFGQPIAFDICGSNAYIVDVDFDQLVAMEITRPSILSMDADGVLSSEPQTWVYKSNHIINNNTGNTGIGIDTPTSKLHVNNTNSSNGGAILGKTTVSNPAAFGVKGETSGTSGSALVGEATASTGETYGVTGSAASSGGTGVFGKATSASGTAVGLRSLVSNANSFAGYFEGGKNYFQGSVGIGTESPSSQLEISGTSIQSARITSTSGSETRLDFKRNGVGFNDWRIKGSATLTISYSDDDFATATDFFQFTTARFSPASDNLFSLGSSGFRWTTVFAVNGTINTSDARLKQDIHDLSYGLDEIMKMRPVSFQWKDHLEYGNKLGLLAQDLQNIIPEVVQDWDWQEAEGGTCEKVNAEYLGVYYSDLIPVLIKGIQEQQKQIETQQETINDQRQAIDLLQQEMEQIRALIPASPDKVE